MQVDVVTTPSRLSRRHQAPLPSVRPVARLSGLGIAAESVPIVRRRGDPVVPLASRRCARHLRPAVRAASRRGAADRGLGRRSPAPCAGSVGLETIPRFALVASRQSLERQSASDRSVRRRRSAAGFAETAVGLSLRAGSPCARTAVRVRRRAWPAACGGRQDVWLVALTSIHWREAWKYGERAFRYCQHDLGHAIAAVRLAAALVGWRATRLPEWSHGRWRRSPASIATTTSSRPNVKRRRASSVTAGEPRVSSSTVARSLDAVRAGGGRAARVS